MREGHILTSCGIGLLFLFLFALRAVHLTADPPADLDWSGGLFFDEGMLVHGARNKVLFGRWDLDEWSDFYLSPILAYIKWVVLSVLGVGLAQVRVIPIAFSVLTLVVFYRAVLESFDRRVAVVATLLLGFNYVFVMFNRLGLTENSVAFFMILTAYLWQKGFPRIPAGADGREGGAYRLRPLLLFLAGVSAFVAYSFKNFPYLLPIPVAATFLVAPLIMRAPATGRDEAARPGRAVAMLTAAGACAAGMLVPFVAWYALYYRRHAEAIDRLLRYMQGLSVPASLEQVLINVSRIPFFDYFVQTPVVLLLGSLGIGYLLYLFFHDRDALRPLDLFMLCWFLAHFVLYAVLTYRAVRYFVPVVPPLCALAARLLVAGGTAPALRIPRRLSVVSLPFLVAWLTVLLGYGLPQVAARLVPGAPALLDLPWPRRLSGAAVFAVLLVGGAALVCRRWGGRGWPLPRRVAVTVFLALPLAAFVAVDGYRYLRWAASPRYVMRDISRELGRALSHAYIAGLGAPGITLENGHRALYVYENLTNDRDTLDRYPVTHLFVGAYNREVDFYYRKFPEPMRRAIPLRVYAIKDSNFYLYSLVEPRVREVRVSKERYRAGEGVGVTVVLTNHDRATPREVRVGWVLRPQEPGRPDVTVRGPAPVALPPAGSAEVVVSGPAPPGTYRLLAFVLPGYENVFEAEFLSRQIGEKRGDPAARNGESWRVRAADPQRGQAVFGPYLRYPPGRLTATFRLKIGDNQLDAPVARVDVAIGGARRFLAARDLRGVDFAAPRSYQEFSLVQYLDEARTLEFRVGSYKRADLWIDRIHVEFTPGEWYERPITVEEAAS